MFMQSLAGTSMRQLANAPPSLIALCMNIKQSSSPALILTNKSKNHNSVQYNRNPLHFNGMANRLE